MRWTPILIALLVASPAQGRSKPELVLQLGHTGEVRDADLYRAGKELRAVTVSLDGRIKVWDANNGSLLESWPFEGDRANRVLVAQGGGHAVIWPRFGPPWKVDLRTGGHAKIDWGLRGTLNMLCRSRDRTRAAIQVGREPLTVVSLPDLKPLAKAPVDIGKPKHCSFGVRDRILATGDNRGYVVWLNAKKGLEPIDRRKIDSLIIDGLDEAPGGGVWAIAGRKHFVIWDVKTRTEIVRRRGLGSHGFTHFTRDGKHIVSSSHGTRKLRYLDPKTGDKSFDVIDDLDVPRGRLDTFRWGEGARREGPWIVVRRRKDTMVEVWDGERGQRLSSLWGHPQHITAVAFFEDARHAAIGTRLGTVERWDLTSGARRPMGWHEHRKAVTAIALSADGAWAATGDESGDVMVRDRKAGRVDRKIRGGGSVQRLQFLPDSKTLMIGTSSTRLFRVDNGFEAPMPPGVARGGVVAFGPKGRRTAFTRGKQIVVLDGKRAIEIPGRHEVAGLLFSPAGDRLLVALEDGGALRFSVPAARPIGELKGPGLTSLSMSADGRLTAALGTDAAVRFWHRDDSEPRASLLIDEHGEWIVWNRDGAFDSSSGGGKYVAWRVGRRLYPVDRFRERYQIPGLLGLLVGKGSTGKVDVRSFDRDFSPPPEVRIVSPEPNSARDDDLVTVSVEVTDVGGGIAEVRLYHQGRLVENVRDGLRGSRTHRRSFDVLLEPGQNRLHATALSDGRVEGRSAAVDVTYGKRQDRIRLRMLAVGINDYRDDALDLKYAASDARSLSEALGKRGGRLFRGGVESKVLLDGQATRQGVREGLDWLVANTRAEDVAVIYLAGHGETVGEEYYFVPQDLAFTGLDALEKGGISQTEIQDRIRRVPARKLVVLLDTCKSGAVSLGFATRGLAEKKALSVLGQAAGIYLVAASTSRQLALEDQKLGHGLFTWSLLRGLDGKADFDGDRAVTIRELVTFLESEVSRVSREKFSREQFPVTHGTGRNFPLVVVGP